MRGRLHLWACLTAGSTLLLIVAGGLVTSTGSGLAVPDWPLSYGMLMPPMVGGVFYEHGHRMIAGAVAILTLVLAVWLARSERRWWVKGMGFAALGAVALQAVLGGLTVIFLLPTAVSVAHACLAQTFFCLTVAVAVVTSPHWSSDSRSTIGKSPFDVVLSLSLFGALYVQLILGALMRHMEAGLAIPDFPLAFGRLVPPFSTSAIAVHFCHRVWALVVTGLGAAVILRVFRGHHAGPRLVVPAALLAVLLPAQIALGGLTVLSARSVLFATAHVATGALILVMSLVIAIGHFRPWLDARLREESRRPSPERLLGAEIGSETGEAPA